MKYLGFDRPSFGFKTIGWTHKGPKISADFTTQSYKKDGKSVSFAELFEFYRLGKAWLVTDDGLVEYGEDVPRFEQGLLIEEEATNLAYSLSIYQYKSKITTTDDVLNNLSAKKLESSDSESTLKCLYSFGSVDKDAYVSEQVIVRNNTDNTLLIKSNLGARVFEIDAYETKELKIENLKGDGGSHLHIQFATELADQEIDVTVACIQYEKTANCTSYMPTQDAPVTRHADYLYTQTDGTTLTGDWDDTLNLWLEDGELMHEGYGKIRKLEIN